MNRPVFVKLGGSILTDKNAPEALSTTILHEVAQTLAAIRREQPNLTLLVGHGGGSFGHYWAEKYATAAGIHGPESWWGVARVADAMARLNRAVVAALLAWALAQVWSANAQNLADIELRRPVVAQEVAHAAAG